MQDISLEMLAVIDVAHTLTGMKNYRTGGSWKVTIVEYDPAEPEDADGHRPSDRLVAMACTEINAVRIVRALNRMERDGQ